MKEVIGGGMVEKVVIGGRAYVPSVQTTFEQDFYVMDRVSAAGLDKIVEGLKPDGDLEEFSRELILKTYRSGKMFEILAGIMVEEDLVGGWSPEEAEVTAEFFRTLTDPEDKRALQGVLVGVILGFFVNADGSLQISPKSSGEGDLPASEAEGSEGGPRIEAFTDSESGGR